MTEHKARSFARLTLFGEARASPPRKSVVFRGPTPRGSLRSVWTPSRSRTLIGFVRLATARTGESRLGGSEPHPGDQGNGPFRPKPRTGACSGDSATTPA